VSAPTRAQFERVAATIAAMKFYPGSTPGVRLEVLDLLGALVTTAENLELFRLVLRDRVPEWPGLGELRAIYCAAVGKPRTGPEVMSGTPGFTGADLEADYRERVSAEQERRMLEWKAEAGRELGAPDRELEAAVAQLAERRKLQ
jgi:hypothetical protein